MKALDGLGQPIEDAGSYYIQDTRGRVGNCALFWGKERSGYVCSLDEAGLYSGVEARHISDRDTDIPWPSAHVEQFVIRHVRVEGLRRMIQAADESRRQHAMCSKLVTP